jgi:hypothetical protein
MARIQYTGSVSEMKGSVAGSTFQRNASGTIVKSKNNQRFSSSVLQSLAQQRFTQMATKWNGISGSFKAEWQAMSGLYSRTDFYGRVKKLNGYQWFQLVNQNLSMIGASPQSEPYINFNPIALPLFQIDANVSTLDFRFSSPQDCSNYYVVLFATAPCSSVQQSSRIQRLFVKLFTGNPVGTVSFLNEYQNIFGIDWASIVDSGNFIVQINAFTINIANGISSPFTFNVLELHS